MSESGLEVVDRAPTLDELAARVRAEDQLAVQAGISMVEHAIKAGEALHEAKMQVPHGDWEQWLTSEFPNKHPKTLRLYMRVARHRDVVRLQQPATLTAANRLLAGEALRPATAELRDEARRLRDGEGLSQHEVARRLGVSPTTVGQWLNPQIQERRRQRLRQDSRASRRALHRQQRDLAARKAGGSVADAYGFVRKALRALEDAHAKEVDRETKRHIERAMNRAGASEDEIAKACQIASEMKRHISLAMERLYAAEDAVVKASRGADASETNVGDR